MMTTFTAVDDHGSSINDTEGLKTYIILRDGRYICSESVGLFKVQAMISQVTEKTK